jgi:hypothetical protein
MYRGLHNAFDFYKDLLYAWTSPHANFGVQGLLYGSIFFPFIVNFFMLNHLGISKDAPWRKPWRFFCIYFGAYTFEITQEEMYTAEISNLAITLTFSTSIQMTLRLYDMLYMGLTQTSYFVFFAMMDFSGFISKTGEFLSLVEETMAKELPIGRA